MLLPILILVFISAGLIVYTLLDTGSDAWVQHTNNFQETAEDSLERNFMFSDPRKLLIMYVLAMFAVPVVLYFMDFSWVVIVLSFVCVFLFPKKYFKHLEAKRAEAINNALPDALGQISGAMRAGSTFITAVQAMVEEQKGPISQEFGLMLREQRLGTRLEDALDNLGERVQTEEMDLVISAALIAQDVGGNLAEIFARLSDTIRKKLEMEGKVKALTAQGVLQGYVVTALPFFILFMLMGIEREATEPMFTSLLGWIFLFVIIVLQVIGGSVIKKIVSIDV
jgi:tight adherence protein B